MSSTRPKRSLLLLAMIPWLVIAGCKPQPITISQRQMEAVFSVGNSFRLLWDDTGQPVNVGGTGGPHTYDFRHLQFVPYDSVTMLSVAHVPRLAARFPPAALTVNEEGNTVYPVFAFTDHSFTRLGRAKFASDTTEWYQHITPAGEWLRFPITLNARFSQTTTVADTTYVNGIPTKTSTATRSDTSYVDGYGTLLLPGGLALQCLRLLVVASAPETSKEFHYLTREGTVILIDTDKSQPDTGVIKRGYVIYFSPQTPHPGTRD